MYMIEQSHDKANTMASAQSKDSNQSGYLQIELRHEKTNVLVSDLVQHKLGCTATKDG